MSTSVATQRVEQVAGQLRSGDSNKAAKKWEYPEQEAMEKYLEEGTRRAFTIGNRGPIRYDEQGNIHPDILEAYWRTGFYVFTGTATQEEIDDVEREFQWFRSRLPTHKGSTVDALGRPAIGIDCKGPTISWAKPLSDPNGGTQNASGRYSWGKMLEPKAEEGAPSEVVVISLGSLQFLESQLRVYGHPGLLKMAEAVNGKDFVPFNEAIWIKEPGRGASTTWHQDGVTHWDSPTWDQGTHGFNFMWQLYGCNAQNGVWVVPGSHKLGKVDIGAWVREAGTERLPTAVPIICGPGDCAITNRQAVHGSFANTSNEWRVTLNFGFHRRSSVLNVYAGGVHNAPAVYTAERIRHRSRLIGYAIDARKKRFPDETPYVYQPHVESGERYEWDGVKSLQDIHDYNLEDLSI